jgi:hypothetical protein
VLTSEVVHKTIGKGFADKLEEVIIESGGIVVTRRGMIEELGCANFNAAANLSKVLRKLGIHSVAQLYRTDPFSIVRVKRIGEAAMFVAMCILDSSDYDVVKWWGWKETNTVKFSTFKHNATKRASKSKHEI